MDLTLAPWRPSTKVTDMRVDSPPSPFHLPGWHALPRQQLIEMIGQHLLDTMTPSDWIDLAAMPKSDIIYLHSSFGSQIRNTYRLWERKWVPDLDDGVDRSVDHPDAISQAIILWMWHSVTAPAHTE